MGERRVVIKCQDCGITFSISEDEKKWYEEKGFEVPKRCKKCRKARKAKKYESKQFT